MIYGSALLLGYLMSRKIFLILLLIFLPLSAFAEFPRPVGFVNDFANVIDSASKPKLENLLSSFERATAMEVVVATLPSLDGRPVEDVAVDLYKSWGIGKRGKDNGLLFLVVPSERKMRIEVGYGLESVINDALAGRLIDEYALPRFKSGDMSSGIVFCAAAIIQTISQKEGISFDAGVSNISRKKSPISTAAKVIVFLIMAYLFIRHPWLFLLFMSGGRGGGGGFGGGFGGFGGGLSGGGGSSRGW